MKKLMRGVWQWVVAEWAKESARPPFPFDDAEAAPEWRDQRQQEAVNRQVDRWQRATSRPRRP